MNLKFIQTTKYQFQVDFWIEKKLKLLFYLVSFSYLHLFSDENQEDETDKRTHLNENLTFKICIKDGVLKSRTLESSVSFFFLTLANILEARNRYTVLRSIDILCFYIYVKSMGINFLTHSISTDAVYV